MRLSPEEQTAIKSLVLKACHAQALYLYGSRVDDTRKGGDIDLFLEPTTALALEEQLQLQYQLISACDTQIDLLVKNPSKTETPFFSLARQGIRLL
jgi:predicted nucleotidyltransferase